MERIKKNKKRLITAEDLCRIQLITSVALSPDERTVAYTMQTVAEERKKYFSRIHMVDCVSGEPRQFTFGEVNDRGIVWSPDGKYIAFVSTRNMKTGIYVIPSDGGGARKIIEADGVFGNPLWTPDGNELVYMFRYNDSHAIEDEKKKKEAPLYRHITRLAYRFDGAGFLPQGRYQIWKVNLAAGNATQLTRGKRDNLLPVVSPDGKWISFISKRGKNPDTENLKWDLFLIPTNGGKEKKIPTPPGPVFGQAFSPDGKEIAYVGSDRPEDNMGVANLHIWSVGVSGKPAAGDLMPKFDRKTTDWTVNDMRQSFPSRACYWSPDGKRIYFVAMDTGSTHIFYVASKGGSPRRVTENKCHVRDYSLNGRMKRIAVLISTQSTPGEIHLLPAVQNGDRKFRVLTAPNKKLFSGITFPKTREVWFTADDGTKLQGWLVTPPNLNKKRRYPALLEIHGGPVVQYGYTFFLEMLFLASQGYVVFYTNPRGSAGRGEAFAETMRRDWGTIGCYSDCMSAADYLAKLPFANEKRMGVTGGSYGGYMTNWIIGHTNRFSAAVTQRSLCDLKSWFASSDTGFNAHRIFGGHPWANPEVYERCSPLTYAKKIKTPLLIIHSENDLRSNIEQAEQLFTTLKLMKKKVEFIRFPGESHGISRNGRPDRRIARLEWIVKWFDRYLK